MPNWKKVIVSGSNASLDSSDGTVISSSRINTTEISASKYLVTPTGSGSVPARGYQITVY